VPIAQNRFAFGAAVFEFEAESGPDRPSAAYTTPDGDVFQMEPVEDFDPSTDDLAEFTGEYSSPEAEVTYSFEVRDGSLARVDRYDRAIPVRPSHPDAFRGAGGTWVFHREGGRVTSVSLVSGRVWDLRFERVR
jgi:hypothetical protein